MSSCLRVLAGRISNSAGLLLAGIVILGGFAISLHPLDSDEGYTLAGAWSLLQGRELYEDTFEYVAPGGFYLIAWGWKLSGSASYAVAKALAVAAAAASACVALATARLLGGVRISVLPALVYFVALISGPIINHNTLFVLPAALSLHFTVRSVLRNSSRDRVLGGLLCGIAILFLQHKGIALAVALIAGIALTSPTPHPRNLVASVIAFVLSFFAPLLLLLKWPPEVLIDSLFAFPWGRYMPIQQVSNGGWFLSALILAWMYWCLRSACARKPLLVIGLAQAGLLLTALQRPDIHHLAVIFFPSVALFPLFVDSYSFPPKPRDSLAHRACILAGCALSAAILMLVGTWYYSNMVAEARSSASRPELINAIAEHCPDSEYLYAGPFIPGLYSETGKLNATRYPLLIERFNTDMQFAQAADDLEVHKPGCVVTEGRIAKKFGHTGNNPVENLVDRNYVLVKQIGAVKILRLSDSAERERLAR